MSSVGQSMMVSGYVKCVVWATLSVCQVRVKESAGVVTGGTADCVVTNVNCVTGTGERGCWCGHRWDCWW